MKLEVFSTILVLLAYLWKTTEAFSIPNTGRHHPSISSSSRHISESVQSTFQLFAENAAEVATNETNNTTISSSSPDEDDDDNNVEDDSSIIVDHVKEAFPEGGDIFTFEMVDHRPLGCTVEESLDKDDDYVFISRITPDGNADKAGLKVGDVVVGVTGLFGGLTIVMDSGVEKITRLVAAVPEEEPLTIQIVRGANVLERHETAIVDMCNMSGANDKEVENCVVDFLAGGYDVETKTENDIEDQAAECRDEETECLIDGMMNLWADELPLPPTTSGITDQIYGDNSAKKPKPWSSRSSPSGTWVRDPKTGQMRNIDS